MPGNTFGKNFRITTWGESHGKAIGCVVDGCPAGLELSVADIQNALDKRHGAQADLLSSQAEPLSLKACLTDAPDKKCGAQDVPSSSGAGLTDVQDKRCGAQDAHLSSGTFLQNIQEVYTNGTTVDISDFVSARREPDHVEILSGVFEGRTTGTPISIIIKNEDVQEGGYNELKDVYRPGHADYTYDAKYGFRDYKGGGRASGRETAARIAGASVALKILDSLGISIGTKSIIHRLPPDGDSIGGTVIITIKNMPAGIGEPVFDKIDALLSHAIMSIGAVKSVEIGAGKAVSLMLGSENNDAFILCSSCRSKSASRNPDDYLNNSKLTDIADKVPDDSIYTGRISTAAANHDRIVADGPAGVNLDAGRISSAAANHGRIIADDPASVNSGVPQFTGNAESFGISKASNNAGGILGGLTDGDDIVITAAIKPAPSICLPQKTVDRNGNEVELSIKGRHDRCIVTKAAAACEAMTAITLVDLLFENMHSRMEYVHKIYG